MADGDGVTDGPDVAELPGGPGSWEPEFPGQREPFRQGNTAAQVSGARGRVADELARQFEAALYADPNVPEFVKGRTFAREVRSWSRAEAQAELLWRTLNEVGLQEFATEWTRGTERESPARGGTKRKIRQGRLSSMLEAMHRAETKAANLRRRLGLSPDGYAALVKDAAIARHFGGQEDPLGRAAERGYAMREAREIGGQDAVRVVTAQFDADAERSAERQANAERVAAVARSESGWPA